MEIEIGDWEIEVGICHWFWCQEILNSTFNRWQYVSSNYKKSILHCIICMNKIFHNEVPDLILIPSFTTLRICDFPDTYHQLHHYHISSYFIEIFPSRCKVQTFQTNDQIGQWQLLRWKNNPEESRFVRLQGNST